MPCSLPLGPRLRSPECGHAPVAAHATLLAGIGRFPLRRYGLRPPGSRIRPSTFDSALHGAYAVSVIVMTSWLKEGQGLAYEVTVILEDAAMSGVRIDDQLCTRDPGCHVAA